MLLKWMVEEQSANGDPLPLAQAFRYVLEGSRLPLPDDHLERVRRLMREHIADDHRIAKLARSAGMSPYHFLRRYQERFGYSPIADLRRMRVELAHELIARTDLPFHTIAERAGFFDGYHLSRNFRRRYGLSPSAYRRSGSNAKKK